MKIWNIGIVGAGMIADFHAQAIRSLPNTQLSGFYNRGRESADILAQKYEVRTWDKLEEMMQSEEIDVVMIASPSGAHMEPCLEAAKNGKHVLCEKPLEVSLERIDRMIEAHRQAGTYLGGIFNFRYNESTEIIKEAIDEGRLGVITYAAIHVPWWRTDAYYEGWHGTRLLDGGGAMMNQSIHMVDLLLYLMGPVEAVSAFVSREGHPQIEVEDTAVGVLKFRNRALGTIYGTTASFPGQFRRLELSGTKGSIVLLENSLQVWQFENKLEKDIHILEKYGKIEGGGGIADPAAIGYETHAKNISSFLKSIEEGYPFEIDGEEARKAVSLILDLYHSAKTNEHTVKANPGPPYLLPGLS